MNSRRILITQVDNKYIRKGAGQSNYQRDWKVLQDRSADLEAIRDCVERACGSYGENGSQDLVLSFAVDHQIVL